MPKVSIILTSYNHEKYIAAAIESVLKQTFSDFELLIFDDGSQDNSHEVIKTFNDARIKLFLNEKNIGAVQMIQAGGKVSTGEYIAIHHSDDIWESTKLEKQVKFLENNPEYEACFTQAKFIDENGEIYNLPENHHYKNVFNQKNRSREEWLNHLFWNSNCFCHPSILARNHPQYFPHNSFLFQLPDYFTWINLLQKKNIYVLEEELIKFRLRRENQNSVSSWSLENLIRVNNEEYFTAREFLPILKNKNFFLNVFPEAKKFLIDGKISTDFAFAKMCLEKTSPAFQKLALEILYDLLHNENKRRLIETLYGYAEKNFIQDTGKFDVFGTREKLSILNCRLYIDFGAGYSEENSITSPTLINSDGNFIVTFNFCADKKITKFRFDPDDRAALSIKIIKVSVNGEIIENLTANAFQIVDEYFNFVTADPFFTIDKEISAENICVEIFGNTNNSALSNFEKKYFETCATVQEKVLQIQQLENSLQEKVSQIQQLENSLHEKVSQIRQLEDSISNKNQELDLRLQTIQNLKSLQNEILNSNSWKLTKPLRSIGKIFRNNG